MFKKSLYLLLLTSFIRAESLRQLLVDPVTQQDGDSIVTAQVSVGVCPGASCPATLSAPVAITNPSLASVTRSRTFRNASAFKVFIGSNTTTLTTTGFLLTESTGTASSITVHDTATYYAAAISTGTVTILMNYNLVP